jgi:hypothetical protein
MLRNEIVKSGSKVSRVIENGDRETVRSLVTSAIARGSLTILRYRGNVQKEIMRNKQITNNRVIPRAIGDDLNAVCYPRCSIYPITRHYFIPDVRLTLLFHSFHSIALAN